MSEERRIARQGKINIYTDWRRGNPGFPGVAKTGGSCEPVIAVVI